MGRRLTGDGSRRLTPWRFAFVTAYQTEVLNLPIQQKLIAILIGILSTQLAVRPESATTAVALICAVALFGVIHWLDGRALDDSALLYQRIQTDKEKLESQIKDLNSKLESLMIGKTFR